MAGGRRRRALRLGLLSLLALPAAAPACSCSSDPAVEEQMTPSVVPEAGAPLPEAAADAPALPPVTVLASDVMVYLGQVATLDGSRSRPEDAAFTWTLDGVPAGSTLEAADVGLARTSRARLRPDVAGEYRLTLTVRGEAGAATQAVRVTAIHAPVFYARYDEQDGGASSFGFEHVTTGETDRRVVTCLPADAGSAPLGSAHQAARGGADWFEGEPGAPALLAHVTYGAGEDGGRVAALEVATSVTGCDGGPARRLDVVAVGGEDQPAAERFGMAGVRFAPDGARVAYARHSGGELVLATVGIRGDAPHLRVGAVYAYPDGGAAPGEAPRVGGNTAPRWVDARHLAWHQRLGGGAFQILTAEDQDDAPATVALRCAGAVVSFDFLPDGNVLLLGSLTASDAGGGDQLTVVHPAEGTRECQVVEQITVAERGSRVIAQALSPDRTRVLFLRTDPEVDGGDGLPQAAPFVMPVSESFTPVRIGVYGAALHPVFGTPATVRWAAGGTRVLWGSAGTLAVANTAGSGARVLASADGGSSLVPVGSSCSAGAGGGGGAGGVFAAAAAVAGALSRRRAGGRSRRHT